MGGGGVGECGVAVREDKIVIHAGSGSYVYRLAIQLAIEGFQLRFLGKSLISGI
jgi:hypothetical protein